MAKEISNINYRVVVDARTDALSEFLTPREVERVNRLVVNKMVRSVNTEVGGTIPRAARTGVTGFRRKRVFKTNARAKRKFVKGSVWIGANPIAAPYVGKMRNVAGGARAGSHFFAGGFLVKTKNGYETIFKKVKGGLVQQTVPVPNADKHAETALNRQRTGIQSMLHTEITKVLNKNAK